MIRWIFLLCLALGASSGADLPLGDKVRGVSLVPAKDPTTAEWALPVRQMNADWVAILPYAWTPKGKPTLSREEAQKFWGERREGLLATVQQAHQKGLKVMLKPMVWVPGDWPGGIDFKSESDWQQWEAAYSSFIFELCEIAKQEKVELFCVGTEFKIGSQKRESYWRGLIREVKRRTNSRVTYAANWDEFLTVNFWDELDYIGIDAYFPMVLAKTPSAKELNRIWELTLPGLKRFSQQHDRPILFTEFGYRSVNYCAWKQWELERVALNKQVNHEAQVNAYQAFFENVWDQDWFGGVFLWQWYTGDERAGGMEDSDYTPQNKPAEGVIADFFAKERAKN